MMLLPVNGFRVRWLSLFVSFVTLISAFSSKAEETAEEPQDVEFNTSVLDLDDRKNIDLSQFSRADFIMPGSYTLAVYINKSDLPEQTVKFLPPENDPKGSVACLTPELVDKFGLKPADRKALTWWHNNQCLNLKSLKGVIARGDLSQSALFVSIPQAYLEYTAENWDPPSRWDNGVPGLLLDYNLNGMAQHQLSHGGGDNYSLSGNGTLGANLGAWRMRADWQTNMTENRAGGQTTRNSTLDWTRYYLYRAITSLQAKLTLGEDYIQSDIFDSFRFTGASLRTDDNMLPPNLRGYAPEVSGIAKTNAKVTISQQGRVIYETQVAAGPFRIQNLNDAVSGELDVEVHEQDGSVQKFKINTSNVPYLSRPGTLRYKISAGKPSSYDHNLRGPVFGMSEFSWGVSNGWSLYGGAILGGNYNALSIGIGRDLLLLGALAFDITQSRAHIPGEETLTGASWRLSYSKRFDEYDSEVTFAGYRFSQKDYMTMDDFLQARYESGLAERGNSKEMYTINFSKTFRDWGLTAYLNYYHQTYWNRPSNNRYNLSISKTFDMLGLRNISLSLNGYRNRYRNKNDDGVMVNLSMPWGERSSVSYDMTVDSKGYNQRAGVYLSPDDRNSYQLNIGNNHSDGSSSGNLSGYYTHDGDIARVSANANYQSGSYYSGGLNAQGGLTITPEGAALHRMGIAGGTRLMVDTEGVADVPVRGMGAVSRSNLFGKAVVDVNSYYRSRASIDIDELNDRTEALKSVVETTLTEGAIGFRRFEVLSGEKAMALIKLVDGSTPPFGATVTNERQKPVGVINDGGNAYLAGVNPGETMKVSWDGKAQCSIHIPQSLPEDMLSNALLLPCNAIDTAKRDVSINGTVNKG